MTQAAIREVAEETGYALGEADLRGPIAFRHVVHGYSDQVIEQDEAFFLAMVRAVRGGHLRPHARRADDDPAAPLVVPRRPAAHRRVGLAGRAGGAVVAGRCSPSAGRSTWAPRRSRRSPTPTDRMVSGSGRGTAALARPGPAPRPAWSATDAGARVRRRRRPGRPRGPRRARSSSPPGSPGLVRPRAPAGPQRMPLGLLAAPQLLAHGLAQALLGLFLATAASRMRCRRDYADRQRHFTGKLALSPIKFRGLSAGFRLYVGNRSGRAAKGRSQSAARASAASMMR